MSLNEAVRKKRAGLRQQAFMINRSRFFNELSRHVTRITHIGHDTIARSMMR
jgi:hypothetical protein